MEMVRRLGDWAEWLRDWGLALLCFVVGSFGLKLVYDFNLWNRLLAQEGSGIRVGGAFRAEGRVRYRPAGAAWWRDLTDESQNVYGGDSIFTGADGVAKVELQQGAVLEILPNSLVVLNIPNEGLGFENWFANLTGKKGRADEGILKLQQGRFRLHMKQKDQPITLEVDGNRHTVTNTGPAADLQISLYSAQDVNKESYLTTLGEGSVEVNGVEVKKSQSVVLNPAGKTRLLQPVARLVKPAQATIYTLPALEANSKEHFLELEWEWNLSSPVQPGSHTIAIDHEGKRLYELSLPAQKKQTLVKVPAGDFTWYIYDVSTQQTVTEKSHFTVRSLYIPSRLGPMQAAQAFPEKQGQKEVSLSFSWEEVPEWLLPHIEIVEEGQDSKAAILKKAGRKFGTTVALKPGRYQWRIRSEGQYPVGLYSEWSEWWSFEVMQREYAASDTHSALFASAQPAASAQPTQNSARVENKINVLNSKAREILTGAAAGSTRLGDDEELSKIEILLRWEPIEGLKKYLVEVFDVKGNKVDSEEVETSEKKFVVKSLANTHYKYKISATTEAGGSVASDLVPIQIQLSAPIPKRPEQGAALPSGEKILLTWEKTLLTDEYEVEVSKQQKFQSVLFREKLPFNFFEIPEDTFGAFYWRVRSLSRFGHKSEWSEVRKYEVK